MARTYADITAQIEKLQREAEALRAKEVKDVISRVKEAIRHYGLTAQDLGFGGGRGATKTAAAQPPTKKAKATAKPAKKKRGGTIKFRDAAGNTWTGVGKRPNWYKDAIASGKTPEDLLAE